MAMILLLKLSLVSAHTQQEFNEAKRLIDSKVSCNKLTDEQLEIIGDYFMEQMHPGEAHEVMDKMMGGEGSESLRQMHIAIAKRIYCNDLSGTVNYGMMGMMMKGGMMNMMGTNFGYGTGMMQGYGIGYWSFINLLSLVLVIGLIVLVYLWIMKLWMEVFKKAK